MISEALAGFGPDQIPPLVAARELESVYPMLHALTRGSLPDFFIRVAPLEALVADGRSPLTPGDLAEVLYWLKDAVRDGLIGTLRESGWLMYEAPAGYHISPAGQFVATVLSFLRARAREGDLRPTVEGIDYMIRLGVDPVRQVLLLRSRLEDLRNTMEQARSSHSEVILRAAAKRITEALELSERIRQVLGHVSLEMVGKQERDRAKDGLAQADRAALDAERLLSRKQDELEKRTGELEGCRSAVADMERRVGELEPDIEDLKLQLDEKLIKEAETGKMPPLAMAERELERAQRALVAFEAEGEIPDETVRQESAMLDGNLKDLVRHVQDRQREADSARKKLDECRADYLHVIRNTLHDYSKRARALAEVASAKLEIELPVLRNDDRSLDEAGIVVRIGFDGKPPTEIGDTGHSGGQQVVAGLILLMSMAETEGDSFFILDEPFAHLSLDRVDDVGKFLRRSGAQFLITVPTTLDRGQLDPASLLVVLRKKPADAVYAPSPIVARAE